MDRKWIPEGQEVDPRMDRKCIHKGQEVDPRMDRKWIHDGQEVGLTYTGSGSMMDRE